MFLTILGFLSGIIGGMGMGGGTILIPALILFAHIDPKIAQSVNLLSSIPMTIFALIIHIKILFIFILIYLIHKKFASLMSPTTSSVA